MKILMLMLGCVLAFLTACSAQTPRPVQPIDSAKVIREVRELAKPNYPQGPYRHRGETRTGGQLWDLSLQQELASKRDHRAMDDIVAYLIAVFEKADKVVLPKCTLKLRILRKPCDNGE